MTKPASTTTKKATKKPAGGVTSGKNGAPPKSGHRQSLGEALRNSEHTYHFIADQSPGFICMLDTGMQCIWSNQTRLAFTGHSMQQEIGNGYLECVHPDDVDLLRKVQGEAFAQRKPFTMEYRLRGSDGRYHWVRDTGQPLLGAKGEFNGYLCSAFDIDAQKMLLDALLLSEASVRATIEQSLYPTMLHAEDGEVLMLSQSWTDISGYTLDDIPTTADWAVKAYGIGRDKIDEIFRRPHPPPQTGREGVYSIRTKGGDHRYWDIINVPMPPLPGGRKAWASMAVDITEKKQADEQLKLAAKVFEHSTEGIAITNADGILLSVNAAYTRIKGYAAEDVVGLSAKSISSTLRADGMGSIALQSLGKNGYWEGEVVGHRKNGEIFTESSKVFVAKDAQDTITNYISIFSDVSERKITEEKIRLLAYHDSLTGLPNRLMARDRMEQAKAYADRENHKLALLFLDLDNFRTINDSLGHKCGDQLLVQVAERLRKCLRDTDIVSRQGGDEFLIMLTETKDNDAVAQIAEKILAHLNDLYIIDGNELSTSASIGISIYPDDGSDFDALFRQADTAMYQAKDSGRSSWRFFDEKMNEDAIEHLHIRNGLRRALKNGEFMLHYQPQVDLGSGEIVGAEALIRWNHPEKGMVPPMRFIPVAEESGLIVPIGDWVLHEACRQAAEWQKTGLPPLIVGVNMSAMQFKRGDVEKAVTSALEKSGLDPALLELELTESILIHDTENVLATIRRLKLLGVKLSIDDFGTGYSSLSYLKRFDVDRLKIDQSFIRSMMTSPEDMTIVRTIINMAQGLNLGTIAEGVEEEAMLRLLKDYRCDEVQGYFFAKPMRNEEFVRYVAQAVAERTQKIFPAWMGRIDEGVGVAESGE